ncbi:MAG TPA: hypothetical protein VF062_02925 [Candidatus Limnocylindrales bacterium]
MFGRKSNTDGLAAATWHELAGGLSSTRDVAAEHAKDLGEQARRRASLAWDALAGRPMPSRSRWPMFRATVIGIIVGWGVSELYRRRRPDVDKAMAAVSHELKDAKTSIDGRIAKAKATPGSPFDKAKAAVSRNSDTRVPDTTDLPV